MISCVVHQPELAALPYIFERFRLTAVISLKLLAHLLLQFADLLDKYDSNREPTKPNYEPNLVLATIDDSEDELKLVNASTTSSSWDNLEYTSSSLDNLEYISQSDVVTIASIARDDLSRNRCDSFTSVDSGTGEEVELLLDPETGLEIYSLEDVGAHCFPWDAWIVVYDKVYDVTEYMNRHPGSEEVMLEYVGYDATVAFRGVGHSQAAFRVLDRYCVGVLPVHERLNLASEH